MSKSNETDDGPIDRYAAMLKLRREQMKEFSFGWFAWRALVIVGAPALVLLADYVGWLTFDTGRTLPVVALLGVLAALGIDAIRRKSFWASTYVIVVLLFASNLLHNEARHTREVARWRIVLAEACAAATRGSELAGQCADARVRADYEPCDFGTTPDACRRELYRNAGWPLIETPIPSHRSGDTLPLGETPE